MRGMRVHFFLTLGALGTVMPYVSVVFRQAGLTEAEVAYAYAIWGLAAVFRPVLLTMIADARAEPRRLLALMSGVTAIALVGLGLARGAGPALAIWSLYCVASVAIFPLQDGIPVAV